MAAGTVRTRAYFDAESAGLYVTAYKITQQNYTDWLTSTLFKEDYDVVDGVPQLRDDVAKLDVSKLYVGATPTAGHVLKINADEDEAEWGAVDSGITVNINGTDETNGLTKVGDVYNIGWKEDADTTGFYSPFWRSKYEAKGASYTVLASADGGGDGGSLIHVTATATITLPAIDTDLAGWCVTIASGAGTTTINAGSGQTLPGYSTSNLGGMDELDASAGSGVLTNCKFITFAMPATGTEWKVIHKGDWGTPIPVTKTVSPSGTTLTIDASRWVSFTTSTTTTGMTLAINNMKDTGTFTLSKIGAGTITNWPSNTYFSGTVANAAAVPWTSHDLITVEKKGSSYYVDVIDQSAI